MNYENEHPFTQAGSSYSNTPHVDVPLCPHCGAECTSGEAGHQSRNPGRAYWTCKSVSYGGACSNEKGHFVWADEVGKQVKRQRGAPPSPSVRQIPRQTHVTPQMVTASRAQESFSQQEMMNMITEMHRKIDFLVAFITQHLGEKEPAN